MGIQVTCDQCAEPGGAKGVLYVLGHALAEHMSVRLGEYPTLLHWSCITDYVRRMDALDKEPPF